MNTPLLDVRDLKVRFYLSERTVHAVNGVSFTVESGQVVGIVGESGCGKSVTSLSLMRLIQEPTLAREVAYTGQRLVLRQFTLQRMVDELEAELENLCAQSGSHQ